jgi:enoyl-CoA hydratase
MGNEFAMDAVVVTRPRPAVAVVTMTRPERLNAMNADLIEGLHAAFDALETDEECRVIILTGAGRGFCAGIDITGYGPPPGSDRLEPSRRTMSVQKRIAALVPKMRSLPQPVIAAVNGAAAGGGLALVLGSDVRLAARSATFNVAFIRIGLSACDIGTSWLLPRIVGVARAQELMLTGRIFQADEAERIGLVTHLFDDDALLDAAHAKADEICANAPWGVALTKEAMWSALEIPGLQAAIDVENRQQVLLTTVPDHLEAMQAFVEKRPPEYGRTR